MSDSQSKIDPVATLSERELAVYQAIAQGIRPMEIANRLGIANKTVQTYRWRVMQKLGVRSTVQLATFYAKRQLERTEDYALLAAALSARVARWEPFSIETPLALHGEIAVGGLRWPTYKDENDVPVLHEHLRIALKHAIAAAKEKAEREAVNT